MGGPSEYTGTYCTYCIASVFAISLVVIGTFGHIARIHHVYIDNFVGSSFTPFAGAHIKAKAAIWQAGSLAMTFVSCTVHLVGESLVK